MDWHYLDRSDPSSSAPQKPLKLKHCTDLQNSEFNLDSKFYRYEATSHLPYLAMATMSSGNFFKAALDKGAGPSLGYWQMMPSTNISRMLAQTPGCDWVLIDCEHGDLDGLLPYPYSPAGADCDQIETCANASQPLQQPAHRRLCVSRVQNHGSLSVGATNQLSLSVTNDCLGALDAGAHGVRDR